MNPVKLKNTCLLYVFAIVFPLTGIFGQDTNNMQYKVPDPENDSLKATEYLNLGDRHFADNEIDQAIGYYLKAANIFERAEDEKNLKTVYYRIAGSYYVIEAYDKAAEYYHEIYTIEKDKPDQASMIRILEYMSVTYVKLNEYEQSKKYYNELLSLYKAKGDLNNTIRILSNLAGINKKLKEYVKSISLNNEILALYEGQKDTAAMSDILNNIGNNYLLIKDYNKAVESFRRSVYFAEKAGMKDSDIADLYINLGICFQNMQDYRNSIYFLAEALKIRESEKKECEIAQLRNIISLLYFYKGDLYNAGVFSQNSIPSARLCPDKTLLRDCYNTYSKILKAGNDHINALNYYESYLKINDSLLLEQRMKDHELSNKRIAIEKTEKELKLQLADENLKDLELKRLRLEQEKQAQELVLLKREKELELSEKERLKQAYELALKKHEEEIQKVKIKDLEQQRALQSSELKRKEAEEKERINEIKLLETENERQKEARKRAVWMEILIAIIAILLFTGFIVTRKKNSVLANRKKEIEEKNAAITDSIKYAEKIQTAVLPPPDFMKDYFDDYFILFKPRDIVSGDFYWGTKKDGLSIVTAADCTGHGVPGAFMSMLGMAFLNEIVNNTDKPSTDLILNELRKNVKSALRQTGQEGETKDGMDIALCIVDYRNKILQFSGAFNPLFLVKDNELLQVKGDRMPIGIHQKAEAPFTRHNIDIAKGNTFYIFSDGYVDQFGGPEGKKIKLKRLQEIVLENHKKPMDEQKQILDKIFADWQGDQEQIDDVLVMGVRI
jgi:serine phosphatase RsbU (regulator of sigma subunit)